MMPCALASLKVFEGISLIIGVVVGMLLSEMMSEDMEIQHQVHHYVTFPTEEFLDFVNNSKSAKGKTFQVRSLEILDFANKNVNWEFMSGICQGIILMITMWHIFCQYKLSTDMLVTKFGKVVSKIESYLAAIGAVTLMVSVTYSDDKKFKEILEYTFRRMIHEEKPHGFQNSETMDWLCPYPESTPFIRGLTSVDLAVERRFCEYGFSKYISMLLFIVECVIYGLMYNYAKSEKCRLGRIALARFVANHVPLPANNIIVTSNASENPVWPIPDRPPSYETLVLNETKSVIQASQIEVSTSADSNENEKDESESSPVLENTSSQSSQSQLPSYELALHLEGKPIL